MAKLELTGTEVKEIPESTKQSTEEYCRFIRAFQESKIKRQLVNVKGRAVDTVIAGLKNTLVRFGIKGIAVLSRNNRVYLLKVR